MDHVLIVIDQKPVKKKTLRHARPGKSYWTSTDFLVSFQRELALLLPPSLMVPRYMECEEAFFGVKLRVTRGEPKVSYRDEIGNLFAKFFSTHSGYPVRITNDVFTRAGSGRVVISFPLDIDTLSDATWRMQMQMLIAEGLTRIRYTLR
ncbi:MAG: hypothetical protein D6746_10865 [Bacteroidetes bacterium]|nr:MAG: hypothetical protein D6746_10865 [Bacteroidota bacterium]